MSQMSSSKKIKINPKLNFDESWHFMRTAEFLILLPEADNITEAGLQIFNFKQKKCIHFTSLTKGTFKVDAHARADFLVVDSGQVEPNSRRKTLHVVDLASGSVMETFKLRIRSVVISAECVAIFSESKYMEWLTVWSRSTRSITTISYQHLFSQPFFSGK